MFSCPKILFLVSLLFVALLNPKFNPYLLFKFLIFYHIYIYILYIRIYIAKQKQPGCKKVRGQSEASMVISDQNL